MQIEIKQNGGDAAKTRLQSEVLCTIWHKTKKALNFQGLFRQFMVGVRGFEPPTPASRTQYSTRLSYAPTESTPTLERPSNREEA